MQNKTAKALKKALKSEYKQIEPDFDAVFSKIESDLPDSKQTVSVLSRASVTVGAGKAAPVTNQPGLAQKTLAMLLSAFVLIGLTLWFVLMPIFRKAPLPGVGAGFLVLDINPGVQLQLDANGRVEKAEPLNADARTLLSGLSLVGLTDTAAAEAILSAAKETGYVSPLRKNNAVLVSATLLSGEDASALTDRIKKTLRKNAVDQGLYCVVLSDVSATESEQGEAERLGISQSKYRLIADARAMGAPITDAEAATISVVAIYERMLFCAEALDQSIPPAYEQEYEELLEEAERLREKLVEDLEKALEDIEDLLEEDDTAEEALEKIEKLIENIEDAGENGENLDALFAELNASMAELIDSVSDKVRQKLETIADTIEREMQKFAALSQKSAEHFTQKREKLRKKAEKETQYYEKDDDFENLFEDFLEKNESAFANNWFKLKGDWRSALGEDYDD